MLSLIGLNYADESLNEKFLRLARDEVGADDSSGQMSRSQKKAARKKLKKKEKKSTEVAFEIEEVTAGFEAVSLREKSAVEQTSDKIEKVSKVYTHMCTH